MSRMVQLQPPPGASSETRAAFAALQAQLSVTVEGLQRDFERRLAALEVEPAGVQVKTSSFTARAGQVVAVEPPPAGITVTLPAASATTRRARVVVTAKNANPVRWESARGLVNGTRQVTSNAPGAAEAICDGEAWHVSIGAATPTGSAASTLGNAKFFLEEADTGLPSARVADDSTEVDLDYSSAGVVSWFLKTASVAFSKLANLTGLSVLGRASNSAGVMAAITATGSRQALMSNADGSAIAWRAITTDDVPAHTWAQVLAAGNSSGATDVQVDIGQKINLGAAGPTTSSPQITCGDATLRIRGAGNTFVFADGAGGVAALASTGDGSVVAVQAQGTGSNAVVSASGSVSLATGGSNRVVIGSTGEWTTPSGSSGLVWTHQGAGSPPTWAAVDLSSVTYTAGDGIDLASNTFSVDVSDFAGTGLEDDGSNNLRIAAAAAGDGLTGGGGSALAVGAGDGIDVAADAVSVDVTDLIGATDSALGEDASNNLEYIGTPSNVNVSSASGDLNVVDISDLKCGGVLSYQNVSEASIDGFTAKPNGFWFVLHIRDDSTSAYLTILENSGDTTTSVRTPNARDWRLTKNDSVLLIYSNNRWRIVDSHSKLWALGTDSVTWSAQQDDFQRSGRGISHIRVTLTGSQTLSSVVPDSGVPDGELLFIENVDTSDTLTVVPDTFGAGTSGNRFLTPLGRPLLLGPRTGAICRRDATSGRWRVVATSGQTDLSRDGAAPLTLFDEDFDADPSLTVIPTSGTNTLKIAQNVTYSWQCSASGSSGALSRVYGALGRRGVLQVQTGITSGHVAALFFTNDVGNVGSTAASSASIDISQMLETNIWIRIPTITSMNVVVGLASDGLSSTFGTSAINFTYNSASGTNWVSHTRNAGAATSTDTGVTVAANTWYKLTITRNGSASYSFSINNVLVATHTTNVTTSDLLPALRVATSTGAARNVQIDRWRMIVRDDTLQLN